MPLVQTESLPTVLSPAHSSRKTSGHGAARIPYDVVYIAPLRSFLEAIGGIPIKRSKKIWIFFQIGVAKRELQWYNNHDT